MERRIFTRVQIPGATIQYKKTGAVTFFNGLSSPKDMYDLSLCGISFNPDEYLKYGEKLLVKINFPDGKCLYLKGQIQWNNEVNSSLSDSVGIRFKPFGHSREYNPLSTLNYLRKLTDLCNEKLEVW